MNENLPGAEVVDSGTVNGVRWWVTRMDRIGLPRDTQYNGYVELPDEHPIMILGATYGMGDKYLDAHGGITYAQGNIVGFDTNHLDDSEARWPLARVRGHTLSLALQVTDTNTEENRATARHAKDLRDRINTAAQELEELGFSTFSLDLDLYF